MARVKTRGNKRPNSSAKRSYRRRVHKSRCRSKSGTNCPRAAGCMRTRGSAKRRSFCRKAKNTRRRRRNN